MSAHVYCDNMSLVANKRRGFMTNQTTPLPDPRRTKDENWAKKIEIAKQAREAGQAIREGKSPVVPDPKLTTK